MRRSTGEITVFSVSFMDLLSNALGVFLMLLLWSVATSTQEAADARRRDKEARGRMAAAEKAMTGLRGDLNKVQNALDRANAAAKDSKERADATQNALNQLKVAADKQARAQAALVGLAGKFDGIVFVFDTSGSMGQGRRWAEHTDYLRRMVSELTFKKFGVVRFSDDAQAWQSELVEATEVNRTGAVRFVDTWKADGGTNTLAGMKRAFAYDGVDTVVLFSDGAPSLVDPAGRLSYNDRDIPAAIKQVEGGVSDLNRGRSPRVVVNTVATGEYGASQQYVDFLRRLAQANGGEFHGR